MPRLTRDQWAAVRLEWEGEPTATFTGLSAKHGINKSEISRRCAKDGWSKRGVLGDINEAAQRKADARVGADGAPTQPKPNAGDLATRTESEDVRATGDTAVIEYLAAKYLQSDEQRRAHTLAAAARLVAELAAVLPGLRGAA